MAHSMKTEVHAVSSVSRYITPLLNWVPKKIADIRRVHEAEKKLNYMEDKIYRYKLHWGFTQKSHKSSGVFSESALEGNSLNENFLSIDDLDEEVRGLIFTIENYSFYEKFFEFDSVTLECKVANCSRELESIIERVEHPLAVH